MKKIANIVYDRTKDETGLYNMCDESSIIPGIPTLIVGWENVKKIYPQKSIIDWKIDDNTYWTFGKREKRDKYEKDIVLFKTLAQNRLKDSITYCFFDILTSCEEDKHNFSSILFGKTENHIYESNNMLYIYSSNINKTIGIYLNDINYEGKDSKRFLELLHSNPNNYFVNNIVDYSVSKELYGYKYIIPYIYS